jgi:HAD superfamily hydrolase (TIGR01509 family)
MPLEALIFDVDGTLAETEEIHRETFNQTFTSMGFEWNWSQSLYRELLRVTGGKERIRHYLAQWHPQDLSSFASAIPEIHARKTARYTALVQEGAVVLRPGVARLIREATAAGVKLAIATTTSPSNVTTLLRHVEPPLGESIFSVMVAGDDVVAKKPAPDVFQAALTRLGVRPSACIALEDSANGVVSAQRAGVRVVVTPSIYTSDDDFAGASSVVSTLLISA